MKKNKEVKPSVEINATYQIGAYGTEKVFHAVLRYLILLTAVIGFGVSGSAMLGIEADFMTVVLASAYTFTTFFLLFKSLRGMIAGIAFGVGGMIIALISLQMSVKKLFIGTFNGIFNSVLDIIKERGYTTVPYLDKTNVTGFGMLTAITALAAVTVGLSCRKRTRAVPYVIVLTVPAVIFMATGGIIQLRYFAPAVAAACAMAVMELAERGVKSVFRSSFVGFTSFVLAALLMLTPIVNTKKAMDPMSLGGIGGLVQTLTPDPVESSFKRSAYPKRNIFTGRKILTVYTNSASSLYLRSWAGGKYEDGSWYSVDYDYGYNYADFARDNDYFGLTKKFLETASALGYDRERIGIGLTDVSIVLAVKQKNLPLPSMSGRTGAIYDGGKTIHPSYLYDGVSTLETPWKGKILTSAAVIDDYDNELLSDVIYGFYEYLVGYCGNNRRPSSPIGRYFANKLYKYGNDEYVSISNNFTKFGARAYGDEVKDEAINRAVEEIFENTDIEKYFDRVFLSEGDTSYLYYGVVHDGYYYTLNNEGEAHALEVAKMVADYLAEGRKYSINPKSTGKSVTEELLFGTKEGYCVQFATVGTLIMRRLGFYARYAEGYIAQDFKGTNTDGGFNYESKITDREGHAWCEVWIDGFGWMPLEFTPGYGNVNVSGTTKPPETTPQETSDTPITTTPPETATTPQETSDAPITTTPPETSSTSPVTTEGEGSNSGGKRFDAVPLIIAAVILIPTAAIVSAVVSSANKKKKRLDALITRALSGSHNSEERRVLSLALKNALSCALGAYGALPKAGELPESYGLRLEAALKLNGLEVPLSLCVDALVKQVYGFGMDENDIKISAFTLRALRVNAPRKLGIFKLIICKIKGVL